jgi:glucose/arabinose dehydrogenase
LFFTERPGRVRVIINGQLQSEPVATITVAAVGEGGLLGIALDPQFSQNGFIYLYYTYYEGSALRNRVVRCREQGGHLVEPQTLIEGIPGGGNHDGGRIAFGPDGKLYIGTGEGGQRDLAQQLDSLGGKILRINPDGSIPADNPFPGSPVYSYGHRNVQGLAWTASGLMLATEHGPSGENGWYAHDELNIIQPGKNYGWPVVIDSPGDPRFVDPLIQSGNDTWAPSGLTFYNGDLLSAWKGSLFFAGLRGQALYRVVLGGPAGDQVVAQEELFKGKYGRLRVVAQGSDGSLYFATNNRDGRGTPAADDDRILRVVPGP